ncbi:leucine-zipper of insertion element IS481 [Pseudonocardia thermophila]|uniref:Leucine-zipper of insertion element IS481 n=1 Tax=Pseudonocardia thermophila TaxID=1848 RepID=A0A1M6PZK3_PSETH|nr:leucine-zipper of insertion element IS481 [Pseudonocardia thermophila]
MAHRNARTTVYARRLMVQRHLAGWSQARIAEQLGVSRPTVSKWIGRYRAEGEAGLEDRSSRPEPSWVRERLRFRPPRPVGRWCHYT